MESNQEQQPIIPTSEETDLSTSVRLKHINKLLYVFIFILTLVLVFAVFYIGSLRQIEYVPQRTSSNKLPTVQINKPSIVPTISLPDFSKETVKPKMPIDISSWTQFDDRQVGLRFKYPSDWGKAEPKLYVNKPAPAAGSEYSITFDNNETFRIWGISKDWDCGGCGGGYFPIGFGKDDWGELITSCSDQNYQCINNNTVVKILKKPECGRGALPFERKMYIYRKEKEILVIEFSSEFISDKYKIFSYMCDEHDFTNELIPEKIQQEFYQAVLNRRLDKESIDNLDIIEKVYDSVESY